LEVDAGTLDFTSVDATVASFKQTGGTVNGKFTSTLTVSGAATFSGPGYDQETGTGKTLLKGVTTDSGTIALDGGHTLENKGRHCHI
jgi:hypothetical protein